MPIPLDPYPLCYNAYLQVQKNQEHNMQKVEDIIIATHYIGILLVWSFENLQVAKSEVLNGIFML